MSPSPPKTMHHFSSSSPEPMNYYTMAVSSNDPASPLLSYFHEMGSAMTSGRQYTANIESVFRFLFLFHEDNGGRADETFQTVALGVLHLFRVLFLRSAILLPSTSDSLIQGILQYIMEHDHEKISLNSLARQFNLSPTHLSRLFSQAYHMSPINYVIHTRITHATEYLLKTNLSIIEIAGRVGYDTPSYFTSIFEKKIGCSPSEYRQKNQKSPFKNVQ